LAVTEQGLLGGTCRRSRLTLVKVNPNVLREAFRLVANRELTRMAGISEYLNNDHRRCDGLLADAEAAVGTRDWARAAPLWSAFRHAIERHLLMEERVLFPAFEARTGNTLGPTEVMRSEHADMRGLLGDLSAAVGQHDSESFLALSDTLLVLLQQHNLKEEQVLYPMTGEVLGSIRRGSWPACRRSRRQTLNEP